MTIIKVLLCSCELSYSRTQRLLTRHVAGRFTENKGYVKVFGVKLFVCATANVDKTNNLQSLDLLRYIFKVLMSQSLKLTYPTILK